MCIFFTKTICKTHNTLQKPNKPSQSKKKEKGKKKRIGYNAHKPTENEKVRASSS